MEELLPIIPRPPDLAPFLKAATDALNRANIAIARIDEMLFVTGCVAGFFAALILLTAVWVFSRRK